MILWHNQPKIAKLLRIHKRKKISCFKKTVETSDITLKENKRHCFKLSNLKSPNRVRPSELNINLNGF